MPKTQETQVQALGLEDTLEEDKATYSSILAWRISWTEEPGGLKGRKELDTAEVTYVCALARTHTKTTEK